MWVICCGMLRSGSTLQYQIAAEIITSKGIGKGLGWKTQSEFEEINFQKKDHDVFVIKMHDFFPKVTQLKGAKFIFSYRDVRDVVVSLCRKQQEPFSAIFNEQFISNFHYNYDSWTRLNDVYIAKYEDFFSDIPAEVRNIAAHLNVDLSDKEINELAGNLGLDKQQERIEKFNMEGVKMTGAKDVFDPNTLLHSNHINTGTTQEWKARLKPAQAARIEDKLYGWLTRHDYEISHGPFYRKLSTWHSKFMNLVSHILDGSLPSVIRNKVVSTQKKNRRQKWEGLGNTDYVIHKLSPNTKIKVYKDSQLAKFIYLDDFEKREITFIQNFLKKGDLVLDVGANIGLHSLLAAEKVKEQGKVYAFEPASETYARLLDNIKLNRYENIIAENLALSNAQGEANISISLDGYDAWNSLGVPTAGVKFKEQTVKTDTLDNYLSNNMEKKIDLIKIDVEGWEIPVIEGGHELLSQPDAPVLIVEFSDENFRNAGYSCADCYELLEGWGYRLFYYDYPQNMIMPETKKEYYSSANIIATKNDNFVNSRLGEG